MVDGRGGAGRGLLWFWPLVVGFSWLFLGGGCGSGGGHGGGFFGGGGAYPSLILVRSSWCARGARGVASLLASLPAFEGWGLLFIDGTVGFGVNRAISSFLVRRSASFFSSLSLVG